MGTRPRGATLSSTGMLASFVGAAAAIKHGVSTSYTAGRRGESELRNRLDDHAEVRL